MKRPKQPPHTLSVTLPAAWAELTSGQLRYLCALLAPENRSPDEVKALLLLRTLRQPRRVLRAIGAEQLAAALSALDWMDAPPADPARPDRIGGAPAADPLLYNLSYGAWLQAENYYAGYLESRDPEALDCMADLLARGCRHPLPAADRYALLLWMVGLHAAYGRLFPYLFRPAPPEAEPPDRRALMLAQIRALTGGDVTRQEAVLRVPAPDALAELDAKAREAAELERMYKK